MKALVYTGKESLEIRDVPSPIAGEGQALIKIESSGLCGSDMHAYLGHDERRPAPLILGHEASGIVVQGKHEGKRVTLNPLTGCNSCKACKSGKSNLCAQRQIISMPPREGAFCQYLAIGEDNLVIVPDGVSPDKASLCEPLACGWHAVRLGVQALDSDIKNARCVVLGGGAIGFGAALVLRAFGAQDISIVEPNAPRAQNLASIDNFAVVTGNDTPPNDVDLVIDAVGIAPSRKTASAIVRPGGVIAHIGLGDSEGGLDIRRITLQEITFVGTYTYTPQDFRDTAQAIFDGRLGKLDWMDIRPLADGSNAFKQLREGKVVAPKIIFKPHD